MQQYGVARLFSVCLLSVLAFPAAFAQGTQSKPAANTGMGSAVVKPPPTPATSETLPDPLTVEAAVQIGVARNPQTIAGQAGVASAAANYRAISALPGVTLGVTRVQGSSTAPTFNGATNDTFIDVGETFDVSGQRRYQAAGARATFNATRYRFEETRITLAQQIRDAYWTLAAARAQTQITQESLSDVQRVYELTRTQEAAGESPHLDVIRASIDVANTRQSYVAAQGAERAALSVLNVLLVRSPYAPVRLADNLAETTAPPALMPGLPSLPELTTNALANRPLVQSARELVHAADYAVKQAHAGRLPDLTVDYERSLQDPVDSTILGIRFPLFDLGSIHYSVRAAQEARTQALAEQRQAEQQVTQQTAQAMTDFIQAQELAASYRTDILTPSVTLLDLAQTGYKQGATGILPVIDATTTLRNARTGYINSLLALYKAQDEILAATAGSLVMPSSPPK